MIEMQILPVENLEDVEVIVDLQLRMAAETENLMLDSVALTQGVRAVIEDPHKGVYYKAIINGQWSGVLLTMLEWSDWRNGAVVWIHSVYVPPEFRNQGVFRQMYQHLRKMVESSTCLRGLRLYVDKRNHGAKRVYENLGMSEDHYSLYEWLKN